MNFRRAGFWTLDRLKGGRVKSHLKDIERRMSATPLSDNRDSRLNAILEHAVHSVPFYSQYSSLRSLDQFPITNKSLILDQESNMLTSGLDTSKLHIASTSGSTGTPLRVFHDQAKRTRINAEAIYWGWKAGYEIGTKLYHLKVWSDRNRISKRTAKLRNIEPIDTANFGEDDIKTFLNSIEHSGVVPGIISYSSILEIIARYLQSNFGSCNSRSKYNVASIIGQSESLSSEARNVLKRHFSSPAFGRYGLEELGIVAQQTEVASDRYLLNRASHHVEILAMDKDVAAQPGQLGRIVVTDLTAYAQPMIRYDTGDLGAFFINDSGEEDRRWLATVSGRQVDQIFDTNDRPMTSMFMYKLWWKYPEIRQYQVIQDDKATYTLRLNIAGPKSGEARIISEFKSLVGSDAEIKIEFTNDDLVYSSGKRRALISNYTPDTPASDAK